MSICCKLKNQNDNHRFISTQKKRKQEENMHILKRVFRNILLCIAIFTEAVI